ncbi:molybdopterin molybdotransferase MoeA [Methylothermus subterraneus]
MVSTAFRADCTDRFESGTLSVSAAISQILAEVQPIAGSEKLPLREALHRILAEPIVSPRDVPAFANAAVDGFAVRAGDLPQPGQTARLSVIGEARAGHPFLGKVPAGQAVRIMTGAPLPEGADTVLMQEHVEEAPEGGWIEVKGGHLSGENVRQAGEDIRQGETILRPGRLLLPPDLGLIASLGRSEVSVKRKPKVALLSTGDELLPQGAPYVAGKLYDSNRFSLIGALQKLPLEIVDYGIVPDDLSRIAQVFRAAAAACEVVISSGGVSVGEADYTKRVLAELGSVRFWKVAIKPGRPLAFGRLGDALFFGLPGNPVAVLVTFYQFVLPALYRQVGADQPPLIPTLTATTLEPLSKKPGRTEFQRGVLGLGADGRWQVRTTGRQGSGILRSMSLGNCFIVLEHERGPVQAGEAVTVWPFSAFM